MDREAKIVGDSVEAVQADLDAGIPADVRCGDLASIRGVRWRVHRTEVARYELRPVGAEVERED